MKWNTTDLEVAAARREDMADRLAKAVPLGSLAPGAVWEFADSGAAVPDRFVKHRGNLYAKNLRTGLVTAVGYSDRDASRTKVLPVGSIGFGEFRGGAS